MRYYAFHVGDYAAATVHLSDAEDLAYRRLLDAYYAREAALPADVVACCRLARATSPAARKAVDAVLREFFEMEADGWHQERCDADIARYRSKSEKARAAVNVRHNRDREARRVNEQRREDDEHTDVVRTYTGNGTDVVRTHYVAENSRIPTKNQEPRTIKPNPKGKVKSKAAAPPRPVVAASPLPAWLPPDAWSAFLDARIAMRAKPTERAKALLLATLDKLREQGHDPRAVLDQSVARSWRGLFPVHDDGASRNGAGKATHRASVAGAMYGEIAVREVDATPERPAIAGEVKRVA